MFETTEHDFGSVARASKIEYSFEFTNLYEEELHVASVRSSCGCTTPRVTLDTVKTYEKSAIVAEFNTRAFTGQRSATVTVTFDKPFYAEVQLHVRGYIRTDVVVDPGAVELGGEIDEGTPVERRVQVDYAGRDDWQILDVKAGNPYLETAIEETNRGGGHVKYDLIVRLKADAPAGYIKDQIVLVTNDRRMPQVPVDVEGRVVSEISINPTSLLLGVLKPGQKVTRQVVIRAKKPFRITGIECNDSAFEIETPDTSKPLHLIPVTFVAGDQPGKVTQTIRIQTDMGEAALELSAFAQVVASTEPTGPQTDALAHP